MKFAPLSPMFRLQDLIQHCPGDLVPGVGPCYDGCNWRLVPCGGGPGTETDPIFSASPSAGITQAMIDSWNTASASDVDDFISVNGVITPNTVTTITHNLNNKYVQVSLYNSADELVEAEVKLIDANTITVKSTVTPLTVVVTG